MERYRTDSPRRRVRWAGRDESRVADLILTLIHGPNSADTCRGKNKECSFSR